MATGKLQLMPENRRGLSTEALTLNGFKVISREKQEMIFLVQHPTHVPDWRSLYV